MDKVRGLQNMAYQLGVEEGMYIMYIEVGVGVVMYISLYQQKK